MKTIIALFCTALFSMSVFASSNVSNPNSNQTARGAWVNCNLPDGSQDYIPSGVCAAKGGTYSGATLQR